MKGTKRAKGVRKGTLGRKKKPGAGKRLGGSFERTLAKALSRWITGGSDKEVFWRSAGSGGKATKNIVSRSPHLARGYAGDLVATDKISFSFAKMFYVEAKRYGDLKIIPLVTKRSGFIVDTWLDTVEKASNFRKVPVLILKQPPWPVLMILDSRGKRLLLGSTKLKTIYISDMRVYIYIFDEFLEKVPPYV